MRWRLILLTILVAASSVIAWRTWAFRRWAARSHEPFRGAWSDFGDVHLDGTPLERVLADWSGRSKLRITVDYAALNIRPDTPVHLRLSNVKLATALDALGAMLHDGSRLTWDWDDRGTVRLTTVLAAATPAESVVRMYPAPTLPAFTPPPVSEFSSVTPSEADEVRELLQTLVDENSWRDKGGAAGVAILSTRRFFVVQTRSNQWLVADMLRTLRDVGRDGRKIAPTPLDSFSVPTPSAGGTR